MVSTQPFFFSFFFLSLFTSLLFVHHNLLVLGLVEDVCEAALSTVLTVKVGGHEHTSSTVLIGALTAQTDDLAILIDLVEFEYRKLDLLLVLGLLASGVIRLLPFLLHHHAGRAPSEGWIPCGCCSQTRYGHPPPACRRISIAAAFLMESFGSTSRVIALLVRVFTKICMVATASLVQDQREKGHNPAFFFKNEPPKGGGGGGAAPFFRCPSVMAIHFQIKTIKILNI